MSAGVFLLLSAAGCPKASEGADAGTPNASATAAASEVTLAPLGETATASAGPAASTPPLDLEAHPATTAKATPTATSTAPASGSAAASASAKPATASAQAQLRQCCAAIRKQALRDAAHAAQLNQGAVMCDGLVAAMAGAPTMPQLDAVKTMLQGAQLPPVCQGL